MRDPFDHTRIGYEPWDEPYGGASHPDTDMHASDEMSEMRDALSTDSRRGPLTRPAKLLIAFVIFMLIAIPLSAEMPRWIG